MLRSKDRPITPHQERLLAILRDHGPLGAIDVAQIDGASTWRGGLVQRLRSVRDSFNTPRALENLAKRGLLFCIPISPGVLPHDVTKPKPSA